MIGKTAVAARLLRYTEKEKAGGTEPRVLYSEGIRCRVPTAEREFAAVRRVHGKQGAKRKVPAKYDLPEPGEVATHVRRARPNGRKYWDVAAGSTAATHVRREGDGYIEEIQAVHVIVSFGLDEVNPDDPEQVRRAFEFVATMMKDLYPGVQMKLVCQADGAGRAAHVHIVQNAVIVERMEVDGTVWEAGRKLSGALTDIGRLRERADDFVKQHGAEYGVEQKLPSVTEQKAEKRSTRDRRMAAKGEISNHDIIRAAFEDSMEDPRSVDLDGFVEVMSEHDVTVNHRVSRAGKPGEKHALSYRLDDMKTPVRGTSLGGHYAFDSAIQQLEDLASGQERERRPEQQRVGAPKPLPVPTAQELADAQALVERLARAERAAQAEDQAAADFFPAIIEDFEAATEADRIGGFTELARLANATREKEAIRQAPKARTTATPSPNARAQAQPVMTPGPQQPTPAVKRTSREQIEAALVEATAQAKAGSENMIKEHLRYKEAAKAADRNRQAQRAEAALQTAPERQPLFGVSLADLRMRAQATREAVMNAKKPEEVSEGTPESEMIRKATTGFEESLAASPRVGPHHAAEQKTLQRLRAELIEVEDEESAEGPTPGS